MWCYTYLILIRQRLCLNNYFQTAFQTILPQQTLLWCDIDRICTAELYIILNSFQPTQGGRKTEDLLKFEEIYHILIIFLSLSDISVCI